MRQGDYTETYLTSEEVAQLQAGGYVVEEIEDGGGTYTVKSGDTFNAIAYANGITPEELAAANPGIKIDNLSIGQVLNLPEVEEVEVEKTSSDPVDNIYLRQAFAESSFRPKVIKGEVDSPVGALGLVQLMPETIKEMKKLELVPEDFDPLDPKQSVKGQKAYMKWLSERPYLNKGEEFVKEAKFLGAYNTGPGNMKHGLTSAKAAGVDIYNTLDWVDTKYLPKETVDYINRITGKDEKFNKDFEKAKSKKSNKYILDLYKPGGSVKSDNDVYAEILKGINAPVTSENLKFLKAWRQAEGGKASNNPFNTTYKLDIDTNKTDYNSVGVKNYSKPEYGIDATIKTLKLPYYKNIVRDLRNDAGANKIASNTNELKTWGTGSLVAKVLNKGKLNTPSIGSTKNMKVYKASKETTPEVVEADEVVEVEETKAPIQTNWWDYPEEEQVPIVQEESYSYTDELPFGLFSELDPEYQVALFGEQLFDEGGIVRPAGDPWEYKKEGDTYLTRKKGDKSWITATGIPEEAIKSKVFKEIPVSDRVKEADKEYVKEKGVSGEAPRRKHAWKYVEGTPGVERTAEQLVNDSYLAGDTWQKRMDAGTLSEEEMAQINTLRNMGYADEDINFNNIYGEDFIDPEIVKNQEAHLERLYGETSSPTEPGYYDKNTGLPCTKGDGTIMDQTGTNPNCQYFTKKQLEKFANRSLEPDVVDYFLSPQGLLKKGYHEMFGDSDKEFTYDDMGIVSNLLGMDPYGEPIFDKDDPYVLQMLGNKKDMVDLVESGMAMGPILKRFPGLAPFVPVAVLTEIAMSQPEGDYNFLGIPGATYHTKGGGKDYIKEDVADKWETTKKQYSSGSAWRDIKRDLKRAFTFEDGGVLELTEQQAQIYAKNGYTVEEVTEDPPADTPKVHGLLNKYMNEYEITNPSIRAAILGDIDAEGGVEGKAEMSWRNTGVPRIRKIYGNRVKNYSDQELDALKKDDVKFFDVVYGPQAMDYYKNVQGWDPGNDQVGDGYKYRGRGLNQLTFKSSYKKQMDDLAKRGYKYDLVNHPELLDNDPNLQALVAVNFLNNRLTNIPQEKLDEFGIKSLEDVNDPVLASRIVANANAGWGKTPREEYLENVKQFTLINDPNFAFTNSQEDLSEVDVAAKKQNSESILVPITQIGPDVTNMNLTLQVPPEKNIFGKVKRKQPDYNLSSGTSAGINKNGGFVAELTKDQVKRYAQMGYIVEEIN